MSEYYIKGTSSDEVQGPLTLDELKDLAKAGKISAQTQHFFDDVEGWQPIETNVRLIEALWPAPKKLELKKVTSSPEPVGLATAPTVKQMLVRSHQKEIRMSAASERDSSLAWLSVLFLVLLHLAMGVIMLLPQWGLVRSALGGGQWLALLYSPAAALGVWLLFLGGVFLLSAHSAYSWARYTALVMMGYLALHAWALLYAGKSEVGLMMLAGAVGFGLGVYALTLTTRSAFFWISIAAAFGGALATGLAFFRLSA
jgi:hypothetical protein